MPTFRTKLWMILAGAFISVFQFDAIPAAHSKDNNSRPYEINVVAVTQPPTLDGVLSGNEWKNAALIQNFTQKEPKEGVSASEATAVLILYDANYIYFGVRCFDKKPDRIVASEMRRDYNLSENDYFEIIIDTFRDHRNAFYFATNSVGARWDCEVKREGQLINWNWDGVWKSAATKDRLGWTAEIAIPFQTLRYNNSRELIWGINFGRYIPRKREEAYWSPISRNDDFDDFGKYKPSKFGILRGLQNIKQKRRFQFKPYSIGGIQNRFDISGTERLTDVGLDAKFHITPNITSDLTVNTDFAQVEADAEQVNISRFNLFFPEKRDFFLEDLDVFNIGEGSASDPFTLLFFSRRIGLDDSTGEREAPIIGGLKVTGKAGPYELGVLDVYTDNIHFIDSQDSLVVPETNFSAIRIKRDIFRRSSLGGMVLSKDNRNGRHNRTFAVDANFAFANFNLGGYLAKTQTPGLKGQDFNGFAKVSWGTDRYFISGSYTDIGANFNPEMGFLQWRDIRKYNMLLMFSPRPKFLNTRQTHFQYEIDYITDHNNVLQFRTIQPGLFNVFKDESFIFLAVTSYYDNAPGFFIGRPDKPAFVDPGIYKYNVFGASYGSDESKALSCGLRLGYGSFYDGTFSGITATSAWKPNNKFGLDLSWQWNEVDIPFPNGNFGGNLARAQLKYSFTPEFFIKTDLQWNELHNRIATKILLNFIPKSGSDIYLVYNNLWQTEPTIVNSNRTVIAKFTYLFDF